MGTNALNDRRAGTDVVLTNLSLGIPTNQAFIGDRLAPTVYVKTSIAKIPVWGTEAFRIREDRVGDYSEPDKLDISVDTTLLEVDGHALEAPVSDRHAQEAAEGALKYDLKNEALQTVVASMRLAREKMQADLITNQAVYSASHKVDLNGIAHRWDDDANDPFDDLIPMLETTIPDDSGELASILWMGQPVWAGFSQNVNILNRVYGTTGPRGVPSPADIASKLGIDEIIVGRAISKTVGGTNTKLWGKNAGLMVRPKVAGKRIQSFAYTIEQTVFGSASEKVITFIDNNMGASGGEWVKRSAFYTPGVFSQNAGSLYYNAVA